MRDIVACGYMGLSCPNLDEWKSFGDAIGAQVDQSESGERLFVRIDERAFRVCIEKGPPTTNNSVLYVGWEAGSHDAFDRVVKRLKAAGVAIVEDAAVAKDRRVERLAICQDPGGNRTEIFVGAIAPKTSFVSPTGAQFVTACDSDGDLGFGHVVPCFDNFDAAYDFYVNLLGMSVTDVCHADTRWIFLRVNPRHHSLAFAQYAAPSSFHHFMFQVEDVDMVGHALDRLRDGGFRIVNELGRHNNDHMISFYVRTPSGIELEYGSDGILIDDQTWTFKAYEGATIWGHRKIA